ncbi:LacI family DNA-binding transcriptional regulator [Phenylobacterium montanum]|uniref:LacI family DNA-binding transcriptional regulator n=1 Tax=Phenylobacterium montanum TaxID=2823693 RepID=A0A975FZT4_9CAUL|nr:LacI family DNA-binding transcriptional regulator [Caulobacter sp. S6]QUD87878.1 LacI family DNA-binding transcriptional regulator [Caulobacter sp. S6]
MTVKAAKRKQRRPRGDRLTMDDLAVLAGVSKVTVSRALSDNDLVAPETRKKVQELAAKHGYKVNLHARNLRLQKSYTVAVVVEMTPSAERPMSDPYPLEILGGISQALASAGYNLLLTTGRGSREDQIHAADGAILLGQGMGDDAVRRVAESGAPFVVWGAPHPGQDYVVVGTDNEQGGALAAERLLALGRRRLVFLGDTAHAELAARLAGYRRAIEAGGARLVANLTCPFTFAGGFNAVESLLAKDAKPFDGLFCGSDLVAMGAIRSLTDHGLSVPGDVSVIGYDDTPMAANFVPPLTSIHQNWREGGILLGEKILALIDGQQPASEVMPASISIRSS